MKFMWEFMFSVNNFHTVPFLKLVYDNVKCKMFDIIKKVMYVGEFNVKSFHSLLNDFVSQPVYSKREKINI